MDLGLKNRVVLVTGAGQGLGEAIGLGFADEGASVAFHYFSSSSHAEHGVRAAQERGVRAAAYQADVRDRGAVDAMIESIEHDLGPIDVVVSNAAFTHREDFLESTPDDWQPQLDVTIKGMLNVAQAVVKRMIERKRGSFVVLTGDSGRVGESRMVVTGATRAAAIGFAKSFAKEFARFNIRANVVALGLIKTPSFARHIPNDPEMLARVTKMYPLRRLGEMEDAVPTVLLLASDRASWITGQVVSVNGGYSMV